MNHFEREIYASTKDRITCGRKYMTDAEIIVDQAKEIERYRNQINRLEKSLREAITKPVGWGETIEMEIYGQKRKFTLTDMTIQQEIGYTPTITIKGLLDE